MRKKVLLCTALCGLLLAGCGNAASQAESSAAEETTTSSVTTVSTTASTTKKVTTTAKKLTIDDVYKNLQSVYTDPSSEYVIMDKNEKTITVSVYVKGARATANRCLPNGNFSADAYEIWLGMKESLKKQSKTARQYVDGTDLSNWKIEYVLLDDNKHSSAKVASGETYYYLLKCVGGYCTYDGTD